MQKFLLTKWYKIILSSSAFIFSVSILIFVLKGNTLNAKEGNPKLPNLSNIYIVTDGTNAYKIQYNTGVGQWDIEQIGRLR